MTATQDVGCEFGAICSAGVIHHDFVMLLSTETMGGFPDWFHDDEEEKFFDKKDHEYDEDTFDKKLDAYLCAMVVD